MDNQQREIKNEFLEKHAGHVIIGVSQSLLFRALCLIENDKILPYVLGLATADYIKDNYKDIILPYIPQEYLK
mgnify:CR=1 FL=1